MDAGSVAVAVAIIMLVVTSAVFGVTLLLSYLVTRMIGSDGWDHSNMTNALRVLSHVVLHPEDLKHMWYACADGDDGYTATRRPFWYVGEDEIKGVVKTRPTPEEKV